MQRESLGGCFSFDFPPLFLDLLVELGRREGRVGGWMDG